MADPRFHKNHGPLTLVKLLHKQAQCELPKNVEISVFLTLHRYPMRNKGTLRFWII